VVGIKVRKKQNCLLFLICFAFIQKGLAPRLLKVTPACAIMISTIEFFRQNIFI
jgi:hypothetical protein